jgi:hypothetical protein
LGESHYSIFYIVLMKFFVGGSQDRLLRTLVASALGIASGIFGLTAGKGLTGSWLAAALIAAIVAGVVALFVHRRASLELDTTAISRRFKIISALATLVALIQLVRLAVFTVNPSQVEYSVVPASKWEVEHSCLTAYFVAAEAASSHVNIYDNALYSKPDDNLNAPRKALMLGPFKIDVYEYPPQFLILPWAFATLAPDFMDLRMVWFALNGGVLLPVSFHSPRAFLGPAEERALSPSYGHSQRSARAEGKRAGYCHRCIDACDAAFPTTALGCGGRSPCVRDGEQALPGPPHHLPHRTAEVAGRGVDDCLCRRLHRPDLPDVWMGAFLSLPRPSSGARQRRGLPGIS